MTLLILTPMFEWYMARLVIKNKPFKDPCYNGVGVFRHHYRFNCGDNWKGLHDHSKGAKNLHFGLLQLLHLYSDYETRNDSMCDSQLLTR